MEYQILLESLKQEIENNTSQVTSSLILKFPLEKLNQATLDDFLVTIVNHSSEYNSRKSLKTIFKIVYQLLPIEAGQLDHLTRLFCDVRATPAALIEISK